MSQGESAGVAGLGQLPSFILPAASGGEVRSWTYRGRRNLVVWLAGAAPNLDALREAAAQRPAIQAEEAELLVVVRGSRAAVRLLREQAAADLLILADEDGGFQREAGIRTPTLLVTDRSRTIYWRTTVEGRPPWTEALTWLAYLNIIEPECGTCVPAWSPDQYARQEQ